VFTIGPRQALHATLELSAPPKFEIDTNSVGKINAMMIEQANNQIYSRTSQAAMLQVDKIMTCDLRQLFSDRSGQVKAARAL